MNMTTIRQVIKARDIQHFFGKKERQSFKMMAEMRKRFAKEAFQPITIAEFCEFYKVKPEDLYSAMQATDEFENHNADKRKTKNNEQLNNEDSSFQNNKNQFQNQAQKNPGTYVFSTSTH